MSPSSTWESPNKTTCGVYSGPKTRVNRRSRRNPRRYNARVFRLAKGSSLKLALFGTGGAMPETALRLLVRDHEVRAVVRPAGTLRSALRPLAVRLGLRSPDPL